MDGTATTVLIKGMRKEPKVSGSSWSNCDSSEMVANNENPGGLLVLKNWQLELFPFIRLLGLGVGINQELYPTIF